MQQLEARKLEQIQTSTANEYLADMYLDWVNNFLSQEKFAAYYGIPLSAVTAVLVAGKECHEFRVNINAGI